MLNLAGKVIAIQNIDEPGRGNVLRLSSDYTLPEAERGRSALLVKSPEVPDGFGAYLIVGEDSASLHAQRPNLPVVMVSSEYAYLRSGDVVRIAAGAGRIRVLYRRNSQHNHFLVTERCDNYCLMCSQPPKPGDDSWLGDEILQAIPLIDPATVELGFTGGEPTILGSKFIQILDTCKRSLPATAVHVLSNGRKFSDYAFAEAWANVRHPDLMVGIPVYSDVSTVHDYVVQADGAFDQTIRGILNLKRLNQKVEIRVVLHQQTYRELPRLAEFIARNLLFADHVALMGLEIMGFTRANLDKLWIDPADYQRELREAVSILDANRMRVSIYNHQLCLLDRQLWPFAVKSISDWKNEFIEECSSCAVKDKCGGFFASAKYKRSGRIAAITN